MDDFRWLDDPAITGYAVTFVRGLGPAEALRRIGAGDGPFPELSGAEAADLADATSGTAVRAGDRGGWAVLIELDSGFAVHDETLPALSAGTLALNVFASGAGSHWLRCAEAGRLSCAVETSLPENRYGPDPDRFLPLLAETGLLPGPPAEVRARTMVLAREFCGVAVDERMLFDDRLPTAVLT